MNIPKSHKLIYFTIIVLLVLFSTWVGIRNSFMSFLEWGGTWAYIMAYCQVYPFLSPLFFDNAMTPILCIQFYYFCQNNGKCNNGVGCCDSLSELLFDPTSSGNPAKCTTATSCNTNIAQIVENNLSITSWSSLASILSQPGSPFLGLFPTPPAAPKWEVVTSKIVQYGSPFLGAGVMLLLLL